MLPDHAALPIENVAQALASDAADAERPRFGVLGREDYRAPRCNDAPEPGLRCIRAAGHRGSHTNASEGE